MCVRGVCKGCYGNRACESSNWHICVLINCIQIYWANQSRTTSNNSKSKSRIEKMFWFSASRDFNGDSDVWYVFVLLEMKQQWQSLNDHHLCFWGKDDQQNNTAVKERWWPAWPHSLCSEVIYSKTVSPIFLKVTLDERGWKSLRFGV